MRPHGGDNRTWREGLAPGDAVVVSITALVPVETADAAMPVQEIAAGTVAKVTPRQIVTTSGERFSKASGKQVPWSRGGPWRRIDRPAPGRAVA